MRRNALWLGFLVLLFIAGTSSALSEEERFEKINRFAGELLESFGQDRESVVKALGNPVKSTSEKHPNRHEEGVEDTLETLEYEGLALTLATTGSHQKHWALVLICDSDRYALRGVRVGDPVGKVLEALGDPDEKTPEKVVYETDFTGLSLEIGPRETIEKIEAHLWLD